MARGRKNTHVKAILHNDKMLFKQLARTGICTRNQAKDNCHLTDNRLSQLVKSGYVQFEKALVEKRLVDVYRLSDKGKIYVTQNYNINLYKFAAPAHDICLTDKYYDIMRNEGDEIIESWRTEGDFLRDQEFVHARGFGSACDAGYTNSQGVFQLIEIITSNYGDEEIQAKEDFAEAMNSEITYVRV